MKYQIVLRLLGVLLLLQGLAMLLCGAVGFYLHEVEGVSENGNPLLISAAITIFVGFLFYFILGKKPETLPKREGLILVGLTWIIFGLFGSLPYIFAKPGLSFDDAFFESASGFTTTGATIIPDLTKWPTDILLWRAVSQWLGGIGILVLFMALLSSLGAGSKFLFKNESSFQASEFKAVKIRDIALILLKLYLAFTLICTLGLKAFGMSWFEATTHAFTTISTAGFSIYNESIGYFSDWDTAWMIESWIPLFMCLSSFSFIFYLVLLRRNFKKASQMEEIGFYLIILLVGLLFLLLAEYPTVGEQGHLAWIRRSLFTVASLSTTTGYGVLPEREWPIFCIPVLSLLMIIGGCAGSTAGGMKVSRLIILIRSTREAMVKAFRPHKYFSLKVNGRRMKDDALHLTVLFIALYLGLIFLATLVVAVLEANNGIDFETAYGAALACVANIGPGFGEVGLWGNFSHLTAPTKVFLAFIMILGRLEIFTLLALLTPATWKKF